jgi:hypothetical protein
MVRDGDWPPSHWSVLGGTGARRSGRALGLLGVLPGLWAGKPDQRSSSARMAPTIRIPLAQPLAVAKAAAVAVTATVLSSATPTELPICIRLPSAPSSAEGLLGPRPPSSRWRGPRRSSSESRKASQGSRPFPPSPGYLIRLLRSASASACRSSQSVHSKRRVLGPPSVRNRLGAGRGSPGSASMSTGSPALG